MKILALLVLPWLGLTACTGGAEAPASSEQGLSLTTYTDNHIIGTYDDNVIHVDLESRSSGEGVVVTTVTVDQLVYTLTVDYGSGEIDVAIVWGPFAGYFAKHSSTAFTIVPVTPSNDPSGQIFAFDFAMGLRRTDTTLARTLDTLLVRERPAIHKILSDYGVPLDSMSSGAIHGE